MTEFTAEMRGLIREELLRGGIPPDMVYDDPSLLIHQAVGWLRSYREGNAWLNERWSGPPAPAGVEPFPVGDLLALLLEVFNPPPPYGFDLSDTLYEIAPLDEVRRFWLWYKETWLLRLSPIAEKQDCDDFTRVFSGLAAAMTPWAGLPIGEIVGTNGPFASITHAWNIFAAKDAAGKARLYYLDTQGGRLIPAEPIPTMEVRTVQF